MKKFFKAVFGKKILAVLLLLIQLCFFYLYFYALNEYAMYIYGGSTVVTLILMILVTNREADSGIKISWMFVMAVVPVFGACLYIYVQLDYSSVRIKKRMRNIYECTSYLNEDDYCLSNMTDSVNPDRGLFKYLHRYADSPVYENTSSKYIAIGDEAFSVMLEEVKKANRFIFLEYFIINSKSKVWNDLYKVLKEKVHEGVDVRVIYDGMGSVSTTSHNFCERLERRGIKCRIFSPVKPFISTYQNNRDHRKMLIIDGNTVFSGGINYSDEYANIIKRFGHWKDNAIMLKGDAVRSFTVMFLRMWNSIKDSNENYDDYTKILAKEKTPDSSGYVIPFYDSPLRDDRVAKTVYTSIINNAYTYVHVMTPYLVLDEEMREALKYAAKRGIDVKIIMPHIPDKWYAFAVARTYYPELLISGVKIYEYTHGFVHSKVTVSDGMRGVVGTINYDYRSLYLHYECGVYLYKTDSIEEIEADFQGTIAKCKRYSVEDYYSSNVFMRFAGRVLRVFAPLM